GVGGLKLRNVAAKYPFERSHRFPLISRIPDTANSFGVFRQTILIVAAFASRNADPTPRWTGPRSCHWARWVAARSVSSGVSGAVKPAAETQLNPSNDPAGVSRASGVEVLLSSCSALVPSWRATPLNRRDNTSFANREKSRDSSTSARIV